MSLFKRPPKPATPPGTPAWRPEKSLEPPGSPLPAPLQASLTEPENLLGAGSAASLAIYAVVFATSAWFPVSSALFRVVGIALTVLQATGWAATIGIGLTSRFRSFRLMGLGTAIAASALYLWKHASGLPAYSFFALAGTLGLAMNLGNVVAWWLSRRRPKP
jgi:hypothetical protein